MTIDLSFPLVKSNPTDAQYEDMCDGAGARPDCQLKITRDFSGASASTTTSGDLAVVNLPLKPDDKDCEVSIDVFIQPGCPPGTTDLEWDDNLSPATIVSDTSEYVYVKYGYPPYEWTIESGHGYTLEFEETTGLRNTLIAAADACGIAQVKVVDMCETEIIGEVENTATSVLNWDWVGSSDTCIKGQSAIALAVIEGQAPYTWSVDGSGFNLSSTNTVSRFNSLNASWCACGSAIITVTDACGAEATGSVRCTDNGEWVSVSGSMEDLRDYVNGGGVSCSGSREEVIHGAYKMEELYQVVCQDSAICGPSPDCAGMGSIYYAPGSWDYQSSLFDAGVPIDCMSLSGFTGCGLTGVASFGECCKSSGSGIISRLGVTERKVWKWECPEAHEVAYDWDNSADTITTGATVNIYVKGGTGPYTWAVVESGYTLGDIETTGLGNTLHAGSGLCGSVVITVEDACGYQTEGSLRNTSGGHWVVIEDSALGDDACGVMSGVDRDYFYYGASPMWGDSWRGKYWLREYYGRTDLGWYTPGCFDDCLAGNYGIGNVSCLFGGIPNCKWTYPWSNAGAGPCCFLSHAYCHWMLSRKLYEWKCI